MLFLTYNSINEPMRLDELEKQAKEIRLERDSLNSEVKKFSQRIRKIKDGQKELFEEAGKEKKLRDEANAMVKENKQKRDVLTGECKSLEKKVEEYRELRDSEKSEEYIPPQVLKKKINDVNWEIETESRNAREERELIDEIKKMKTELKRIKKSDKYHKKMREVLIELKTKRLESRRYHSNVIEYVKKSDIHHKKLNELLDQLRPQRKEMREISRELEKARKKANKKHREFLETRKSIKEFLKREKEERRKGKENELRKMENKLRERAEKILKEYKGGKKLTLEELALLDKFKLISLGGESHE